MQSLLLRVLAAVFLGGSVCVSAAPAALLPMEAHRSSADDLELDGIASRGAERRFVRYRDLLALPQQTFELEDSEEFHAPVSVSGVPLATLLHLAGIQPSSVLVAAVCSDGYRGHFSAAYIAAHHPILVLTINGRQHDGWQQLTGDPGLGPYFIANPHFVPAFRILAHANEEQRPYGVARLFFEDAREVEAQLRPPPRSLPDSAARQGYLIAREDCLRCHNRGSIGGDKAGRSWDQLAAWAHSNPSSFERYVRSPALVLPCARMPGHADYDAATLHALTAYFDAIFDGIRPASVPRP